MSANATSSSPATAAATPAATPAAPRRLFAPVALGPYRLDHRVVMAPLTRMRAEDGAVPGALMALHYGQRASTGGLLIGEATIAAAGGNGYLGAPGLFDDRQIAGWRQVVEAVHAKGARIFAQLYHAGRQSHADLQPDGGQPVGASEVPHGGVAYTASGWVPTTPNRALAVSEIHEIVAAFKSAAERAREAGFDGVEIHAANGYLIDQFLQDGSNRRTDAYGGPVAHRARFLLEITDAIIEVWGADRVAVRLGPDGSFGDMGDSDPEALFTFVAAELAQRQIAYLHLIEPRVKGNVADETRTQAPVAAPLIRRVFPGTLIVAGGFDGNAAEEILQSGAADLVAFGRHFIANPDLPERLRRRLPLNPYDRDTFYGGTAVGYTDYPAHAEAASAVA